MLYIGKRRLEAASLCVAVMDSSYYTSIVSRRTSSSPERRPGRRRELHMGAVHLAFGQTSAGSGAGGSSVVTRRKVICPPLACRAQTCHWTRPSSLVRARHCLPGSRIRSRRSQRPRSEASRGPHRVRRLARAPYLRADVDAGRLANEVSVLRDGHAPEPHHGERSQHDSQNRVVYRDPRLTNEDLVIETTVAGFAVYVGTEAAPSPRDRTRCWRPGDGATVVPAVAIKDGTVTF